MRLWPSRCRCRTTAYAPSKLASATVSKSCVSPPGPRSTTGQSQAFARIAGTASGSGAMMISPSMRPRMARSAATSSRVSECELLTSTCRPSRRAARSTPRITSEKNSPCRSGSSTPIACVRFMIRLRATPFGQKRSFSATERTRRRVSSLTRPLSLNTRETVATDTPASRATSLMFAIAYRPAPSWISSR